ncbi:MAG TPA: hypothetical protein VF919_11345 [Gemmatimonadales bacterium]
MKPAPSRATLQEFVIYFLKLGTLGFAVIVTIKRVPEPALIAASGVVGLLLKHAL